MMFTERPGGVVLRILTFSVVLLASAVRASQITFSCQMTAHGTPEAPLSVPMQWTGVYDLEANVFSLGPTAGLSITVKNPDWIIAQRSLDFGKAGVMANLLVLNRASGEVEYSSFANYCFGDNCKDSRYETRFWSGVCSPGF